MAAAVTDAAAVVLGDWRRVDMNDVDCSADCGFAR